MSVDFIEVHCPKSLCFLAADHGLREMLSDPVHVFKEEGNPRSLPQIMSGYEKISALRALVEDPPPLARLAR